MQLSSQRLWIITIVVVACVSAAVWLKPASADDFFLLPPEVSDPPVPQSPDDHWDELDQLLRRLERLEEAEAKRTNKEKQKPAQTKPTVNFSQELQLDTYTFNQDADSKAAYGDIENGAGFRRARVALMGEYGPSEYRIEFDFAQSGRPTFLDVYGGFHDVPYIGRIRVGHFFEPFLLDRLTSNRVSTFMERTSVDQAFAPSRASGIGMGNTYANERGTWALGVFRPDDDAFGDGIGDTFEESFDGRLTYLPYYCKDGAHYVHIGGAYSIRGADDEQVRFRAQPEARVGAATTNVPFFVDTGTIPASFYQLIGFEAAWVNGPFSIQSEYVMTPVSSQNDGNLLFQGWYVLVSYFLTGEHRPYDRENAIFSRVKPKRDFLRYRGREEDHCVELGPGAWEIATRLSVVDLDDGPVHGGHMTDLTVGLNWYMTPYTRITSNYIHSFAESPSGLHTNTDILGARFQYEF